MAKTTSSQVSVGNLGTEEKRTPRCPEAGGTRTKRSPRNSSERPRGEAGRCATRAARGERTKRSRGGHSQTAERPDPAWSWVLHPQRRRMEEPRYHHLGAESPPAPQARWVKPVTWDQSSLCGLTALGEPRAEPSTPAALADSFLNGK